MFTEAEVGRPLRIVVLLWLILVAVPLPVREVMPPDESRFAHQAQKMIDTGDWVVPRIGDVPVADKPPLLFWAIDVVSLPFGRVMEWTARVPPALASLVILLLVVRLGRRLRGSTAVGLGAAAILLTGIEFFQKSEWVACDMPMTALAWIALTLWREALFDDDASRPGGRWRIALGWAAAGAGTLTKGPVGLLWPAFWVVAEAVSRRRWRPLARLLRPEGPVAYLAIVAGWLAAVEARAGAGFVRNALFTQTVTRYLSAPNSVEPWHFYLRQMPADLLPWSFLIPGVLALIVVRWRGEPQALETLATRTAALFLAMGFLFFSLSSGKRGVYVLPSFPAFALLASDLFVCAGGERAPGRGWRDIPLIGMAALGLLLGLAPLAALAGEPRAARSLGEFASEADLLAFAVGGFAVFAGAVASYRLARSGRPGRSLAAAVAGVAVLLVAIGTAGGAAWNRYQDGRRYGREVAALVPAGERMAVERGKFELILFYSRRLGTEFETAPQLLDEIASGRCRYVILRSDREGAYRNLPPVRRLKLLLHARVGGASYDLLGPAG